MNKLIIWGASGHGKVVLDVVRAQGGFTSVVFIDDAFRKLSGEFQGCRVAGARAELASLRTSGYAHFVVAIGCNTARAECFQAARRVGIEPATLVHPTAAVSRSATIGPGTVVMPNTVINPDSVIGANCIINSGAIVEHDCCIADHVHLSPGVALGGGVRVCAYSHIGLNASVLPGTEVGERAIVGAGAVVLECVAPGDTVAGVPAKSLQRSCHCDWVDSMRRILLSIPHMGGKEERYVREAFASNWLSTVGPNLTAFEQAFEARIGLPAVALGSGTAAIHLGLRLLDVAPGDEVFCPTLTFAASCNPVRYLGAEPVFLDSDYSTWNLDPNILEDALQQRAQRKKLPRALVVVHLYGQCADMDPILALCRSYDVPVLEDAAEALGAKYHNGPAGTVGDVGAFSFNGNKIITTTGGGMLASRNAAWVEKARFWAQQARDPGLAYEHSELGYNYRMSNVLAGIGRGQLEVLNRRVQQRRAIAFRYRDAFADLPGITLMPQASYGLHTNWLSCFLIEEKKFGCSRDALIRALDEANVESRPIWKPMHLQPLYAGCERYGGEVAADLFRRGICLPSSSSLTEQEQLHVVNTVRRTAGADALSQMIQAECLAEAGD